MARVSRPADRLEIIAPDRKEHYEAILDLTAKAFAGRRYWGWIEYCNDGYLADSPYDWKSSRIGLLDGKIVTHYGIWDHRMRIGTAAVRVAGVGAVATDGAWYNQGLMARTAAACVADLAGYGYHLTMLDGISDFYHRFGYVRAWPEVVWLADLSALPRPAKRPSLRPVTTEWRDLDRLYNRQNRALTGTALRPTYRRNRWPKSWKAWCWRAGRSTAGYVIVNALEDALELVDHAGDADQVLAAVAHLAAEAGFRRLRFPALPYRSELCRRLRGLACRCEQSMRNGGWMVRTVRLAATLARLRPVFARRLAAAGLDAWRGDLLIEDPRERILLGIRSSRIDVRPATSRAAPHAVRGGEAVAQLLVGTDRPEEIAAASGLRFSGDALMLARALFPAEQPTLGYWDYY